MNNNSVVPESFSGQIINGRLLGEMVRRNKYNQIHYHWTCVVHTDKAGVARVKDIRLKRPQCCYLATTKGPNNPNWKGSFILGAKKFNSIKNGAAVRRGKKGIPFEVTPKDLEEQWDLQNGLCIYTGRDLVDINSSAASLDRINSEIGYVMGNIEWVHKDVNLAKQSLTRSSFLSLCKETTENFIRVP